MAQKKPKTRKGLLDTAKHDPHGDTIVAQINPAEAGLLMAHGGAGVRSPHTGLLQFYSDSANEHSRATTGGNMADHSRPGGAGTQGGGNAGGGHQSAISQASTGMMPGQNTTSWGAPIHTNQLGVSVAESPSTWKNLNTQVDTYNDAARNWNAGTGPSVGNFFNNLAPGGFSMERPDFSRPNTYQGGDYHLGWDPSSLAGLAVGAVGGPFAPALSKLVSPLASKAYHALGGNDLMLGGPDVPSSFRYGLPEGPQSPGAAPSQPGSVNMGQMGQMAGGPGAGQGQQPGMGGLLAPIQQGGGQTAPGGLLGAPGQQPPSTPQTPAYAAQQRMGAWNPITGSYGWQSPTYTY